MRRAILATGLVVITIAMWSYRISRPRGEQAAGRDDERNSLSADRAILDRIVRGRPRDFFPVLNMPKHVAADQTAESMADQELILGINLAGEPRAYPINFLEYHDMLMDKVAGTPILVTW